MKLRRNWLTLFLSSPSSIETNEESNENKSSTSDDIKVKADGEGSLEDVGATSQETAASIPSGHQVIAVSASKGPTAYFNLARKFLINDEYCDLSALEAAILVALDTANLLQRSQLATIVR